MNALYTKCLQCLLRDSRLVGKAGAVLFLLDSMAIMVKICPLHYLEVSLTRLTVCVSESARQTGAPDDTSEASSGGEVLKDSQKSI